MRSKLLTLAILSVVFHQQPASASACTIYKKQNVCIGDRVILEAETVDKSHYYVEVLGFKEYSHGGHELQGRLVGNPQGLIRKTQNDELIKPTGPVTKFPDYSYGVRFKNPRNFRDIILSSHGRNYFVYSGELGYAKGFTEQELQAHLELEVQVTPAQTIPVPNGCPNLSGIYEFRGCAEKGHKLPLLPSSFDLENRLMTVSQKGCEELKFSYNIQQTPSQFSIKGTKTIEKYDISEGKIIKNGIRMYTRDYDLGQYRGVPYIDKNTKAVTFLKVDGVLQLKIREASKGVAAFVVPNITTWGADCEYVKKAKK